MVISVAHINACFLFPGIRALHADRNPSDAASGVRDRPRVYVRHPQAAAHDHLRLGQAAHPDLPEFARPATGRRARPRWGPAHVRHRLRGDGAHLQHRRRGVQSKAVGLRGLAHGRAASGLPAHGPSRDGRIAPGLPPARAVCLPAAAAALAGPAVRSPAHVAPHAAVVQWQPWSAGSRIERDQSRTEAFSSLWARSKLGNIKASNETTIGFDYQLSFAAVLKLKQALQGLKSITDAFYCNDHDVFFLPQSCLRPKLRL